MEKRNFFGPEGLTSTSATHVAELCKNYYQDAEAKLASIRFYGEKVGLLSVPGPSRTTKVGWNDVDIEDISRLLDKIIAAKSLCGWLREAVKEIQRLYSEASQYMDTESRAKVDDINAQLASLSNSSNRLSAEQVRQGWSIGEQETYIALETECAVIGKFIHESGPLHDAKVRMLKVLSDPVTVTGEGANAMVYERTVSVPVSTVNDIEAELQARHRSAQAQLNGMKHKVEVTLQEHETQRLAKQSDLISQKNVLCDEIMVREAEERMRLTNEVGKLRIIIPNDLKGIYATVTNA